MARAMAKVATKKVAKINPKALQARLQARLEEDQKRGVPGVDSDYIKIKKSGYEFKGRKLGTEFNAIILNHVYLNEWFDKAFDPDTPGTPACFSISNLGPKEEDMVPHEKSPLKQSDFCKDCDKNEFGTAIVGKGKACGNKVRMALIPADNLDNLENKELAFLRTGVLGGINFEKFRSTEQARHGLPVCAFVVKIGLDDTQEQSVSSFDFVDAIEDMNDLNTLLDRSDDVVKTLTEPYDVSNFEASGKASGKKVAKKKTVKKSKFSK